ncbi:MAG: Ribosomal protein L11 methyltransferase [Syntrophus sp. PtaU1.Bin005]|jgi:ribosomal protein L11 methyltransferase|uniref:50S ribosomal protein L11 methyltransferase n=1 Tax=Syntrophus buswellii TaxID=43774 RepID=UPI0009C844E5|nr:MAG: Ribosomal protein L11 methyltransferase [Syntrophus sp. PtaU1.Bin005]
MASRTAKDAGNKGKWLKIVLSSPPELVDALSNFVTELGAEGVYQEENKIQSSGDFPGAASKESVNAYLPFDVRLETRVSSLKSYLESLSQIFPELDAPELATEIITDPDWGEQWKKYFKPLRVSRGIVIKPTWERYTPQGRDTVIEIDPGMAFGTGQHASTRMCLEALETLILTHRFPEPLNVLDVGTGTGILGIACAKLGAERVLCVDIDPKATEIAMENIIINSVGDRVSVTQEEISTLKDTYNLIVANLTAKLLIKLKKTLTSLLRPGGYLIISGIIDQNQSDIEAHFFREPLKLLSSLSEKEWVCYVLKKETNQP